MLRGVHHASFTVPDMDRSIAFYVDSLGMRVVRDSADGDIAFEGPICDLITGCPGTSQRTVFLAPEGGTACLELVQYTPRGRPQERLKAGDDGCAHVCFYVEDVDGLYEVLKSNGVETHCPPQDWLGHRVLYFRDPDGNVLEAATLEYLSGSF